MLIHGQIHMVLAADDVPVAVKRRAVNRSTKERISLYYDLYTSTMPVALTHA
jgi:hypothetical protein